MLVPVNTRFKAHRGGRHPAPQRRPGAGHDHRLPRRRLRGPARGRPTPSSRLSRPWWPSAAPPPATAWRGTTSSHGPPTEARAEVRRRVAALGPDDPSDIMFTSGTTGAPEGGRADPRPHPRDRHRLGRDDRPPRRRPLPDDQPVLPHVRAEGRHPRLGGGRRHDVPAGGVRRRRRCWPASAPSTSPCCPARPPSTSRSSSTPTATGTTSRASASPSPAPPTSRSS